MLEKKQEQNEEQRRIKRNLEIFKEIDEEER